MSHRLPSPTCRCQALGQDIGREPWRDPEAQIISAVLGQQAARAVSPTSQ